jgi:hypothetical protein
MKPFKIIFVNLFPKGSFWRGLKKVRPEAEPAGASIIF